MIAKQEEKIVEFARKKELQENMRKQKREERIRFVN
jgi:heme exporter protein D